MKLIKTPGKQHNTVTLHVQRENIIKEHRVTEPVEITAYTVHLMSYCTERFVPPPPSLHPPRVPCIKGYHKTRTRIAERTQGPHAGQDNG